ncbi:MAG: 16S rRNA (uracil(1498)-N(3))-methyltransferase [Chloroflexi bacterium OHK40]
MPEMDIPNTRRFFVPPQILRDDQLQIDDAGIVHQISRVLRLRPGDQVLLLDGEGTACVVELVEVARAEVRGRVLRREPSGGEPRLEVSLYLALTRHERFEWSLQKAVELGARRLIPVQFARSLPADRADARRLERWRRIAREAAEQACRGRLPEVAEPCSFARACEQAALAPRALVLWEREAPALRDILRGHPAVPHIALLSGPEGGITPEELTAARAHGIMPTSLGPRILRAETAPIAAIAAILYEFESP